MAGLALRRGAQLPHMPATGRSSVGDTSAIVLASIHVTWAADSGGSTGSVGCSWVCRLRRPPFRPSVPALVGSEWKGRKPSLCGLPWHRLPLAAVALQGLAVASERLGGMEKVFDICADRRAASGRLRASPIRRASIARLP